MITGSPIVLGCWESWTGCTERINNSVRPIHSNATLFLGPLFLFELKFRMKQPKTSKIAKMDTILRLKLSANSDRINFFPCFVLILRVFLCGADEPVELYCLFWLLREQRN